MEGAAAAASNMPGTVMTFKPEKLEALPNSPGAEKAFKQWLFIFSRYKLVQQGDPETKLTVLANCLSAENFDVISDCATCEAALDKLKSCFIMSPNVIISRHKLATRTQLPGENIDEYLRQLEALSRECAFKAVSSEEHRKQFICDAFIAGITSQEIRTRLLENEDLTLEEASLKARALEVATRDAATFGSQGSTATVRLVQNDSNSNFGGEQAAAVSRKCFFCGRGPHARSQCPASNATCRKCEKRGHFSAVCRSSMSGANTTLQRSSSTRPTAAGRSISAYINDTPSSSQRRISGVNLGIDGRDYRGLLDTGSGENYIHEDIVDECRLNVFPYSGIISLADSTPSRIKGLVYLNFKLNKRWYRNVKAFVLPSLCTNIILGETFQGLHSEVIWGYGGSLRPLKVCAHSEMMIPTSRIFTNLSPNIYPIATNSRSHHTTDLVFIDNE